MKLLGQLTGIATLVIVGIVFVTADVFMLIVFSPWVRLKPSTRVSVLSPFAHGMAQTVLFLVRHVGRARIDIRATVPLRGGVLMVMNHQSLIDIPAAAATVPSGCPRMVARARYGRGIPLVSHMIAMYGHILVQPGKMGRSELDALAETARASALPILIYPEGHRTQDGEIRPWKRGGLDALLSARDWNVYVLVVDGLWRAARLADFVSNLWQVRCRVEMVGPFEYDGRGRDNHDEFAGELRRVMCAKLAEMRSGVREKNAADPVAQLNP